jgi:hypothetical protein
MTSEGFGEMLEDDSSDMCAGKFPLVSMGGRVESLWCADPGARTHIGASGNFSTFLVVLLIGVKGDINPPNKFGDPPGPLGERFWFF